MDKNTKIIIVENNDGHITLIEKNLIRSGIKNEIIRFSSGNNVIEFFKKDITGSFIILLDLNMPGIDGISVLKWIKSNNRYKGIPVIILSTSDDSENINLCKDLGCNKYIKKPICYTDFVETIKDLVNYLKTIESPAV